MEAPGSTTTAASPPPPQPAASAVPPSQPPSDAASRLALLEGMSREEQLRYYLWSRSRISPEVVMQMAAPMLPPAHLCDDSFPVALAAAAKAFVVQLAEEARGIADAAGAVGAPLQECHIVEAWRRLQARGAIPGLGGGGGAGGGGSGGTAGYDYSDLLAPAELAGGAPAPAGGVHAGAPGAAQQG